MIGNRRGLNQCGYPVRSVAANENDVKCMTGPMCGGLDHLSEAETVDNGGEFLRCCVDVEVDFHITKND